MHRPGFLPPFQKKKDKNLITTMTSLDAWRIPVCTLTALSTSIKFSMKLEIWRIIDNLKMISYRSCGSVMEKRSLSVYFHCYVSYCSFQNFVIWCALHLCCYKYVLFFLFICILCYLVSINSIVIRPRIHK
jgi:hypothetical protein